jgi:hypothetical protein
MPPAGEGLEFTVARAVFLPSACGAGLVVRFFLADFFGVIFFDVVFLGGILIGICIPVICIWATAGAGSDARATALTAANSLVFTVQLQWDEVPPKRASRDFAGSRNLTPDVEEESRFR